MNLPAFLKSILKEDKDICLFGVPDVPETGTPLPYGFKLFRDQGGIFWVDTPDGRKEFDSFTLDESDTAVILKANGTIQLMFRDIDDEENTPGNVRTGAMLVMALVDEEKREELFEWFHSRVKEINRSEPTIKDVLGEDDLGKDTEAAP